MALQNVIQTRVIDHNDEGQLLNIALATLSNAAVAANQAMRKGEFDTEVTRLDSAIAALSNASSSYVDTTSLTLTESLAAATFDVVNDVWVFGGTTNLNVGDVLFLDAATEQDSDRAWLMIASNGVEADFKAFGNDVDAAIAAAVSTLKGDAVTYVNLGIVEDKLALIDGEIAEHSHTKEYTVTWADQGDGTHIATIDTSTDFGTRSVHVRILKDNADANGFLEHISTASIQVESSALSVRLTTDSGTIVAATLIAEVTGTPAA